MKISEEKADCGPQKFPIDALPKIMQEIIFSTNENLGFPVDFIGCSLLSAASIAVGNSCRVRVMTGWEEGVLMYLTLVGKTGICKSHPMDFALLPLKRKDAISNEIYQQKKKQYDQIMGMNKNERKDKEITEPEAPKYKRKLVSNFTLEALVDILSDNPEGIGVYADELAGWFKNFNRYNNGSDLEFWLSCWSQKAVIQDRKSSEPVFLKTPFVGVMGSIQPSLLKQLSKEGRSECGFLDRILFCVLLHLKKAAWPETEMNPEILKKWSQVIDRLFELPQYTKALLESMLPLKSQERSQDMPGGFATAEELLNGIGSKPFIFTFSLDAWEQLRKWQHHNKELCDHALDSYLSGVYSKLEIYTIRLSLLMQTLSWACGEGDFGSVGQVAVSRAIQLTEYFRAMANEAFGIIYYANPLDELTEKMRLLYEQLPDSFRTKEGYFYAEKLQIPLRNYERLLTNKKLFSRIERGLYKRVI